jgi:hypothetical protein
MVTIYEKSFSISISGVLRFPIHKFQIVFDADYESSQSQWDQQKIHRRRGKPTGLRILQQSSLMDPLFWAKCDPILTTLHGHFSVPSAQTIGDRVYRSNLFRIGLVAFLEKQLMRCQYIA